MPPQMRRLWSTKPAMHEKWRINQMLKVFGRSPTNDARSSTHHETSSLFSFFTFGKMIEIRLVAVVLAEISFLTLS